MVDAAWAPHARARATHYRKAAARRARSKAAFALNGARSKGGARKAPTPRWYLRRARSLERSLERRMDACGLATGEGPKVVVRCGCGTRELPVACGVAVTCPACAQRKQRRLRRRLTRGLRRAVAKAWSRWHAEGRRPGARRSLSLLTLTQAPSGDLGADRVSLGRAWEKLRKWLHRRVGAFDFALVWEVTPGTSGKGHVHAHVAVLLPFVDFAEMHEEWRRATGGRSSHIDAETEWTRYKRRARPIRERGAAEKAAASAADYLAKYTSKGVQPADFAPEVAAHVIDAMWERRACSTSYGFDVPAPRCCTKCQGAWEVVERPEARDHGTVTPVWEVYAPARVWFEAETPVGRDRVTRRRFDTLDEFLAHGPT